MKRLSLALLIAGCGASTTPVAHGDPSGWAHALESEHPFGCDVAPIWAHEVVWPIRDGALGAFAASHQSETQLVTVPEPLASQVPHPAQVLVPTTEGLCAATLGPARFRPDDVIGAVPMFLRAVEGCAEHAAPLALLCPPDAHVPTALRWAPFEWSAIQDEADADPIVQRALDARAQLLDIGERNASSALEGVTEVHRGRSARVVVGDEEVDAAQIGLAFFDPGVDVETGCPALDLATGEITTPHGSRWRRLATSITYVGVLHDAEHVLGLVQDTFTGETENCDDEHECFFVAIATPDHEGLVTHARAISSYTSAAITTNSPLRFMDTRSPCNGE